MALRDHAPIILEEFNGLWRRGSVDSAPRDHFNDCRNIRFRGDEVITRGGIDIHQLVGVPPLQKVLRIYNYNTQTESSLIVLVENDLGEGEIYHVTEAATFGPLLTIATMTDFAFVQYAGRAYISPFTTYGDIEKGIDSEFLYVYLGDGTAARKAAGSTPAGTLTVANGGAGNTDAGFKLFAVVGETDTGFLSSPFAFASFTTSAALSVSFSTIPLMVGAQWVKRHIVATKNIVGYNGDTEGYQYFFIPLATINDNTTTTLSNISFFDADLLEDASHLLDNYDEIPAGATLTIYHNRLCLAATFTDISLILVSAVGEPEAISQIDGLIIAPLDGNPITNLQEFRDILYVFKRSRTLSYYDNGDVASSWPLVIIDQAIGCPVHGIATVLDSGSTNLDYLVVCSYKGIVLFNGRYVNPELTYKIRDLWLELDRTKFRELQALNDPVDSIIYIAMPDKKMLVGDYTNGMDNMKIRWTVDQFNIEVTTIALFEINTLIIGSKLRYFPVPE